MLYQIFPHVQTRVDIWLDPWADPTGKGYQILQSLFALAAGGLFGRGLGNGYLLLQSGATIIPALETDFIFSAIGEELGLAGSAAIVLLYLIFVFRGLRIALRSRDEFSRLLATGLTTIFGLQAFLIMGGVTKLIPADRDHAALRQLRGQFHRGQLRPAGAAAAGERRVRAGRGRGPRERCSPAADVREGTD